MDAYVSGYAACPKSLLSEGQVAKLKRMATVTPRSFNDEPVDDILGWRESDNYLYLPVARGVEMLKQMGVVHVFKDKTSLGSKIEVPRLPDPYHPDASPGQAQFMEDVLAAVQDRHAILGKAGTGNGKTVVALWTIAMLGRTALIVVPGATLANNWKDEIKKHLGLDDSEIGWIQQKKCDFRGKKVVIAVVHSLCRRAYPPAFYQAFGTVVYDEVHSMAAATFSKTLGKLTARYKMAFSATPTRKDGCENVFLNYFGSDIVDCKEDKPLECDAYIVDYQLPFPKDSFPESPSIALNILSKLKTRNQLITKWIGRLYAKKRTIIVMSDRIEQLHLLRDWTHAQFGVPMEEMAMYAAQKIVNGKRVRVTQNELQTLKKRGSIRIYFTTYGIFKQGENIPRLDAGIEATPRADGIQPPGRIRRRRPGKSRPVWVSIRDNGSWLLMRRAKSRIKEFQQAHIKIKYANG